MFPELITNIYYIIIKQLLYVYVAFRHQYALIKYMKYIFSHLEVNEYVLFQGFIIYWNVGVTIGKNPQLLSLVMNRKNRIRSMILVQNKNLGLLVNLMSLVFWYVIVL